MDDIGEELGKFEETKLLLKPIQSINLKEMFLACNFMDHFAISKR